MTKLGSWTRRKLFGVSPEETTFERRKFRGDDATKRERLEQVGATFLVGYHAALDDPRPEAIAAAIEGSLPPERRGFAFEGAGMGLALVDAISVGSSDHLARHLQGPGHAHDYMTWIGVGWAIARLGGMKRRLARIEPRMRALAADGIGFHMGYFHTSKYVDACAPPKGLPAEVHKSFDQGVGRCLWFVEGAGVDRVIERIRTFPASRHPDLWAGIGLACTYAGGVTRAEIERLRDAASDHAADFAQGCSFAVSARERAGNPTEHSTLACELIWGRPRAAIYALVLAAGEQIPEGAIEPPYEVWRNRIKEAFTKESR
jgi:hypothetical protein